MNERGDQIPPSGWAMAKIGELVCPDGLFLDGDWVESKDQDPEGDVRLIQLADIGDGVYLNRSSRFLTSKKATELRCKFLKPGDVLIARMPDPLGRACIFPGDPKKSVTAVDVCIVRLGSIGPNNRWLVWAVNSPEFRSSIAALESGTTRKRISRSNLATLELPVPPLPEQHRIFPEIEKQFTRLDAAVAALKRIQANLKRYRASVLKAACEGRLVPAEAELARAEGREYKPADRLLARILKERRAKWEADQLAKMQAADKPPKDDKWRSKYQEPAASDGSNLGQLPEGWMWTSLSAIAELKGGITKGQKRRPEEKTRSVPYLRVANVQRGFLDLREAKEIEATEDEIGDLRLRSGDILFNEGGDRDKLGRGWVWRGEIPECIHQNHVFRARLYLAEVRSKFISWYGNSIGQDYFVGEGKQTTNLASINLTKLAALPIPLPPSDEQRRIVAEVERRLSTVDEIEALVAANLKRAQRLRQAILKRAFEGELVPQDPNDEPADALLERIRAEWGKSGVGDANRKLKSRRVGVATEPSING